MKSRLFITAASVALIFAQNPTCHATSAVSLSSMVSGSNRGEGVQQDQRKKQADEKQKQQAEEAGIQEKKKNAESKKQNDSEDRGNAKNSQPPADEPSTQTKNKMDRRNRQGNSPNRNSGNPPNDSRDRMKADANESGNPSILMSPSGSRLVQLSGNTYSRMTEIQVIAGDQVSKDVVAKIQRSQTGATIELIASRQAELASFTLQGKINGRWTTLPLELVVEKNKVNLTGGGQRVEVHPRQVITMPDGSTVVIGQEKIVQDTGGATSPTNGNGQPMRSPVVASWTPQRFGDVGGTLTVNGANFSDDIHVQIGNITMPVAQRSATQITVNLPDNSDDCPPAALRVVREDGFVVLTCEPRFFVRGDKPLHHIADTSGHDYLNSYLMGRLSRFVYNDYHGVSSWTEFQSSFESQVLALGATDVQFVKGGSGPGDTELAIIANPAVIVVVFRGSENPVFEENGYQDWINTNADVGQKTVNSWQPGAWVHEGVYNACDDVQTTLTGKLASLRNNNQPVFLTGHSLGGALATMAAYRMSFGNIPVRGVYTYGSPRVGNIEWVKAYDNANLTGKTWRWVNRQDFAPRYPVSGDWRHVGLTNNIHMDGSVRTNDDEVSAVLLPNPIDHNMDTYCTEILQELSNSQKNKISAAAQ